MTTQPSLTPAAFAAKWRGVTHVAALRDGWLNALGLAPAELEKRTLSNLYNQRATWLVHAHATLDDAVFAAYSWPADLPVDPEILERLLALNLERATAPASEASGE